MTQTVSNAVAQRDKLYGLVESYKDTYEGILPSHMTAEAFVRLAQGVLRRNDDLAHAAMSNPLSLTAALLDCARLGHEPGTPAYYLVAIKGSIEGWEGYRGVIERIYRAGAVQSVRAAVVRQKDFYDYEEGMPRPVHRFERFASAEQRGRLVGVYAFAEMRGGGISRVVEMGRDEVMRHKEMNRSSDRADSPWQKWEESMWLKCAAHELEKWVPSSSEYRREELRAQAAAERAAGAPASGSPIPPQRGDVLDGVLVDVPGPDAAGGFAEDEWPETAQPGGDR
ncbi:recombinase RecT [Micromonospora sp. DT229]|uniref:recombinase RecT n=1 Tax=Micromonospora sp. DT229 TaxID=3393430 RepID=UPI003CF7D441